MELPILYKTTKTGAIQQYRVSTKDNIIYVEQGQVDGKKQVYETVITKGINKGKSNETTPTQQAELEAKSKHAKKIKAGYTINKSGAIRVQLPQKIKVFQDLFKSEKTLSNLILPCYVTPKLDGINGIYRLSNGELTLTSRGGETYPIPEHHVNPVKDVMTKFKLTSINVELYIHGQHLQDITSAVKKQNELSKYLVAFIFELPDEPGNYESKISLLQQIVQYSTKQKYSEALSALVPAQVKSIDEIEVLLVQILTGGYEGLVITNARSTYQYNTRSSNVWKYKIQKDGEYKIIDFKLDKNNHPVYICETKTSTTFSVKRKGTSEERLLDGQRAERNIGKWLTIKYEQLSKDGIPLKPVGINFRDCNEKGVPQT